MAVLTVTELQRYVERVQQRLLTLERRFAPPPATRGTSGARNFSYFKVTKPILPGRQGLGVQVSYNTLITSDPIDPEDPEQFWLSDEYEGWTEISSAEYEIHDSAHKTLAMVGDIIVAEYRYNKWRTFTEFGLANVRVRVLEGVDYETGPAVQAKYQILIGENEVPQFYEGQPVYVTRMISHSLTVGTEFLFSYDRTAKEWFSVHPTCDNLPNPGAHTAIAGETIAPGETGAIVYGGKVYQVLNHSECSVSMGNRVTWHVSPLCESFFTTCVCCGAAAECPVDPCCCQPFAVCVNGLIGVYAPRDNTLPAYFCGCINSHYCCNNTLFDRFIPTNNCYPRTEPDPFWGFLNPYLPAMFEMWVYCDNGVSPYLEWRVTISNGLDDPPTIYEGTESLPGFCEGETISITIEPGGCPLNIKIGPTLEAVACGVPETPEGCCAKLLWLCLNNDSAELSVNGGSHIFDVTACCEGCTSAELRVTITCNPESENPLSLNWQYWCDGVQVDAGAINISAFCTSDDPMIYNLNPGCFLQLQVSINDAGCDGCGPTVYVPPPPA